MKKKMSVIKKIILSVVSVAVVIVAVYMIYNLVHYKLFRDYKEYLGDNEAYEEGTLFTAKSDASPSVAGMQLAAENDFLKLYIDTKTAETAVYDKRSGVTVYSNPVNSEDDPLAGKTHKAYLQSQLIVDFYNAARNSSTYNSYDYSTSRGQFEVQGITDGVRVLYTLGDMSSPTGIVPEYIESERLETFLANLSEKNAKYVRQRYSEWAERDGWLTIIEGAKGAPSQMRRMNEYLAEAGYTEEDFNQDMLESGVDGVLPTYFTIPLEYKLEADGLRVRIPVEHIEESGDGKVNRIQVLRYFGASDMADEDGGYMLVPNGAGSIINFNNGKTDATGYSQYVYNIDPVSAEYLVRENLEAVRMPFYGMYYKNTDTGIFTVIEKADSHAMINANVAGSLNAYNYAYPTFIVRGSDTLAMFGTTGNAADLPIVEPKLYNTDIIVRYSFLEKGKSDYSGMANYYRGKLVADGTLKRLEKADNIPFYMDMIGGVKVDANILGVSYLDVFPMTTYKEAENIVEDLIAGGVNRPVINYQGWFNGGYYHDAASKIKLVKELGSKKELEGLTDKVEAAGGKLYGDVAFQKVSFIADNFNYTRESARYYGAGYTLSFGQVNPLTLQQTYALGYKETLYNVISPKFLVRYVDKFADKIGKYDISGISLRDLGDLLTSDKKRTEIILREEAKEIVKGQFEKLENTGKQLMVSGGNAYTWKYTDDLINIPVSGNRYLIVDEDVPFYQMLVHGYIDYAGQAINLDDSFDSVDSVLTMVEYGSAPHFTFTSKPSSEMKYTGLNSMYSTTYKNQADTAGTETVFSWDELAKSVYAEVNGALKNVTDAEITKHELLSSGVVKVEYSNGVIIYVNKQAFAADADGTELAAKSFEVRGVAR